MDTYITTSIRIIMHILALNNVATVESYFSPCPMKYTLNRKKTCLTFKITNRSTVNEESWVLKCNPLGCHNPWCSVS